MLVRPRAGPQLGDDVGDRLSGAFGTARLSASLGVDRGYRDLQSDDQRGAVIHHRHGPDLRPEQRHWSSVNPQAGHGGGFFEPTGQLAEIAVRQIGGNGWSLPALEVTIAPR